MAIEIVVEGKLEKESEKASFTSFLQHLCKHMLLKIEDYGQQLLIEVCPKGEVEVSYEGCFISMSAKTSMVGPGFHAFVCKFIDEVIEASDMKFEVQDPTNFYRERNFENLKHRYFYKWLKEMVVYAKEDMHEQDFSLCWTHEEYLPTSVEGHVITAMGYKPYEDFHIKDIEEIAMDFFIWNTVEKDARYYRNCALSLLWDACFYEYSNMNEATEKVANTILDYLEAAYEQDHMIALPWKVYAQLCDAVHREQVLQPTNDLNIQHLGYRKQPVYYYFGNWYVYVHGCAEKSFDKTTQTMHFMAPYKDANTAWEWMIKANIYPLDSSKLSIYDNIYNAIETFTFSTEVYQASALIQRGEEFLLLRVFYQSPQESLVLDYYCKDESYLETMKQWCKKVRFQVMSQECDMHS